MDEIVQLKITLKWSKPPIWRRILVKKDITFDILHNIIQAAMGWENCHLYDFETDKYFIDDNDEEEEDFMFGSMKDILHPDIAKLQSNLIEEDLLFNKRKKHLDTMTAKLHTILDEDVKKFVYTYDFGDDWEHDILVEKYQPFDEKTKYPVCIAGKFKCPEEDSGGMSGYYYMLEALRDNKHPEHKNYKEWMGGSDYDPLYFDMAETNLRLSKMKMKRRKKEF